MANITIGPFKVQELENLQNLLSSKAVTFEVYADEDLKEKLLAESNQQATFMPRSTAGQLDLRYLFFEIPEDQFHKAAEELEKLGITAPTDGSWELSEET